MAALAAFCEHCHGEIAHIRDGLSGHKEGNGPASLKLG